MSHLTTRAASKDFEGMAFDGEARLAGKGSELALRQAERELDDLVTLRAGEVMVMWHAADAIPVRAVGEGHAVEDALLDEHIHRAEDGGTTELRIDPQQLLPEIVGREVFSPRGKLGEPLRDQAARTRVAQASRREGIEDYISRDRHLLPSSFPLSHIITRAWS
jgi:hypothetical protein